jgi:DNA polymerase III subunit epsilon
MALQLLKPLCFFDIESTGLNVTKDRIVEISFVRLLPDGSQEEKHYLLNPLIPISAEAAAIHGITDDKVAQCPSFADVAADMHAFIGEADLAGFNALKFDIPMLLEEFARVGIDLQVEKRELIDVQVIFHKMEERTLAAAYRFYCDKDLENAHSAHADTMATLEVFKAQIEKYNQLPKTLRGLAQWMGNDVKVDLEGRIVLNENQIPVFNFGKHKGKSVKQVFQAEPSYYSWMMDGDFSAHTKRIITKIKMDLFKITNR